MEQLQRLHSNCPDLWSWMESPGSSALLSSRGPSPRWQQGHLLSGPALMESLDVCESFPREPGCSHSNHSRGAMAWLSRIPPGAVTVRGPGCGIFPELLPGLDRSSAAYLVCSPSYSPCLTFISSSGLSLSSVMNKTASRESHFRMWFHIYLAVSPLCGIEVISLLLSVFPLLLKKKGWGWEGALDMRCCSSHKFVFCETLPRIR